MKKNDENCIWWEKRKNYMMSQHKCHTFIILSLYFPLRVYTYVAWQVPFMNENNSEGEIDQI